MSALYPSDTKRAEEAILLLRASQEMEQEALDKQYEQSKSYITIVVGLGYVGFFAIWNFAQNSIPAKATSLTGILMGVSLLAFILFEVRKMLVMQRVFLKRAEENLIRPNITDIEGLIRFGLAKQKRSEEFNSEAHSLMISLVREWQLAVGSWHHNTIWMHFSLIAPVQFASPSYGHFPNVAKLELVEIVDI